MNIEMLVGVASLPPSFPFSGIYMHFTVETGKAAYTFATHCNSRTALGNSRMSGIQNDYGFCYYKVHSFLKQCCARSSGKTPKARALPRFWVSIKNVL